MKKIIGFVVFVSFFVTFSFGQEPAQKVAPQSVFAFLKANRSAIPVYTPTANKDEVSEKNGERNRETVVVPSNRYRNIQSALNARECNIKIRPGLYKESLTIFPQCRTTAISALIPGTVSIDDANNNRSNTISLWPEANGVIENLTLVNHQRFGMYDVAAVQGWGGIGLRMVNCIVYSRSIGVSTAYASHVEIINSKFIGLADNSVGITTYLNNEIGSGTGVRIFDNLFTSMEMAIYNYELHDAGVQTIKRCQGNGCTDSNQYSDVAIIFEYENGF